MSLNHGTKSDGTSITDDVAEAMADEADRGYDVDEIVRRRGGRPTMGSGTATVESVRLDPDMKRALLLRASIDGVSVSETIRRAVGQYLKAS